MFKNIFDKLKKGLEKTKNKFADRLNQALKLAIVIDDDLYEQIEEILVTSDISVESSIDIIDELKDIIRKRKIKEPDKINDILKEIVMNRLTEVETEDDDFYPKIILMIGINGVGKTTTIGKLSNYYINDGRKVLVAAGDTFRAAAIEQLEVWAERNSVDIVKHNQGSDPSAVIFDAIKSSKAKKIDVLICDTAGRLHNKKNLMNELNKIDRVIGNEFPEAKKEVLLVLDGTAGQNSLIQAQEFKEVADITGIVLTKLDGTAKGGMVLSIKEKLNIPIKYVGIGEGIEDLEKFSAERFVEALF